MKIDQNKVGQWLLRGALCFPLIVGGYLVSASQALAGVEMLSGALKTEFAYHQVSAEFPAQQRLLIETESDTKMGLSLSGYRGACQYELKITGHFSDFLLETDQATISGFSGSALWELGKKDWTWGKGLAFIPNYPLGREDAFWGLESKVIFSPYNLVAGAAWESAHSGASWLRVGKMLATGDWETVISYIWRDGVNHWQGGAEFSWDLLNGLSLHGGMNTEFAGKTSKYLLGGVYTGAYLTFIMEYYYTQGPYLFASLGREPGLFGRWQWGIKKIFHLQDGGWIRIINLKYLGDNTVTPEIVITNFGGGKNSAARKNPIAREYVFQIEAKF